jgi:type IV secretion system protein VirB4
MNNIKDFFDYFAGNQFPITMTVMVMIVILAFLFLMIYIPMLTKKIFPKFGYSKYASYLPFDKVYNDNSMSMIDGSLIKVYRVEGIQTSLQDDETKEKFLTLRAQLFNQIRDPNVVLRFYMIRNAADEDTKYEFHQPTLQRIYNKWRGQGLKIFLNNYYVVLSVSGNDARAKLNQYGNYIESMLAAYKPKVLRNNSADNMACFLGRILSPISKPCPKYADNNIANLTTVDDVEFLKDGMVRYVSGGNQMFASMLSFKISPDYLDEEFFDSVSTIQTEMITMNGFRIMGTADVKSTIKQKRAVTEEDKQATTEEQIFEAEGAMDENVSGNQTLVNYYPLFVLFGATKEELQNYIDEFKKISAMFGVSPVVETFAAKVSWFAQVPGFDVFPRSFKLLSKTAAISIPMSSQPRGVENSDWGKGPLVVFPTAQGTPYQFQFHVSDKPAAVGHTLTIGPTGGGKTTLFSFLIAQSLRHPKLKAFFFDRNKGAEIFTLAAGGKYITMHGKEKDEDKLEYNFSKTSSTMSSGI